MFSCKFLLMVAFTFTTLIALPPGAEAQRGGGSSGAAPSYLGPCDVIRGGCAEAYSMTRAMKARYAGPLFQLVRLSDNARLNVRQKNHVVDTSGIPTFCHGTYCLYSEIYAQMNGNNFIPATTANGAATPAYCATANACAAIFWIDPTTGLPAIRTAYPSEYVHEPSSTGITGGTNALSVMMDGRNEGSSTCCGAFGISHPSHSPDLRGTMMTMWFDYGNAVPKFMNCHTSTTFCMGIDQESANRDGADYGSTLEDVIGLFTFTGGATGGTVTGTLNGTQIFSHTPTYANTLGANMAIGTAMRLGGGGDLSHVDVIFREGLITNGVVSVPNEAAARNNMTTFYGAYRPAACQSTADMSYYFGGANYYTDNPVASSLLAVGLRQMRASQTGPIVDLRDLVTNVVNAYGPAAFGCGIDPAAATFCATNGCAVATLYNQGTFSTRTSSSAYDFTLSMTATSTSAQPTVTFNSLNGLPTMHFTGTQMLCTRTLPNLLLPNVPIGWSVVAKRTPSAGAGAAAAQKYSANGAITLLGWGSRTNTFNYWVATGSPAFTGTASDGHWHQLGWESNSRAGNVANDYVDGATLSSSVTVGASGTSFRSGQVCIGGRPDTGPSLSGDVAELVISLPKDPTSVGFSSLEPTIFARDEAAWGMLPH